MGPLTSAIALLLLIGATPATARAQAELASDIEKRRAALALADKGYELFTAGKYAEAIEQLQKAEATFHAPSVVVILAQAHVKLGRLVEARSLFERVVAEPLAAGAPAPYREAQQTAQSELQAVAQRIPKLQIVWSGVVRADARLTIDDVPVPIERIQPPRELNPGEHVVVTSAPGVPPAARTVRLDDGETERLELALPPDRAQPAATAPIEERPSSGSPLPAIVAFGVGGAGLAVGAVAGALALGKAGELKDACGESLACRPEDESTHDTAISLATASTVGFAIGAVGVAAGVVLLVVRPGTAPRGAAAGSGTRAWIGSGKAGVGWRF